MAGNIPGTNNSVLPGVYTQIETQSTGVSIPGGTRIVAIIGEGVKEEVVVASASGGGEDGFNSDYTSVVGSDGRHFKLSGLISTEYPIVSNTVKLYKKGLGGEVQLNGLEQEPSSTTELSGSYDFRIGLNSGKIELQKASIKVQDERTGAKYLTPAGNFANRGVGTLSDLAVSDVNAPPEKWVVKCVSVSKDPSGNPIAGTARFVAFGSISGNKLVDGSPVIWVSDGDVKTNGTVEFAVNQSSGAALDVGDYFTFEVKSGVLAKDESLRAEYVPTSNLNDPTFLTSLNDIAAKHGKPSTENTLSLGAQLAIANGAPGVMCVQAKPATPKRTSYTLADSTSPLNVASTNLDDFIFPLPTGVVPDADSQIHFFLTDLSTNEEKQYLPNKVTSLNVSGLNAFINELTPSPAFSYAVVDMPKSILSGFDGQFVVGSSSSHFKSSAVFPTSYAGNKLKIIDSATSNNSMYSITSVSNGNLLVSADPFEDETSLSINLIDSSGTVISLGSTTVATSSVFTGDLTDTSASSVSGKVLLDLSSYTLPAPFNETTVPHIKVSGSSAGQNGKYKVITIGSTDSTAVEITIQKFLSAESNLRFDVIDTSNTSPHVVITRSVAKTNHTLRVNLIDQRDASFYDAGWLSALASLEAQDVDIIVPLPRQNISAIFQNTLTHCKVASSIKNKRERVLFCGAIRGLAAENLVGTNPRPVAVEDIGVLEGIQGDTDTLYMSREDLANYSVPNSFGYGSQSYRSVYFYPDEIVVQANGENKFVDGFYMAAAAGGYLSAETNIAMPLTNKVLTGFTILNNKKLTNLKKEQMADSGITVVDPVAGGGRVVWGKTTTKSGYPEEEEISIVFIRDRMSKALRDSFAGYIGLPEDASLVPTLTARAVSVLNGFISQGFITQYTGLQVQRDSVDPRQWNVSVKCQPNYPVNFIFIKVSLGII